MDSEVKPLVDIEPGTVVAVPDAEHNIGVFTGVSPDWSSNSQERVFVKVHQIHQNTLQAFPCQYSSGLQLPWTVIRGKQADKVLDQAKKTIKNNPELALVEMGMDIGGDPEIFVVHDDNSVFPAWEYLPRKGGNNRRYWDGFQAEAQVPSGHCIEIYTTHLRYDLKEILRLAMWHDEQSSNNKGAKLSHESVIYAPEKILATANEEYINFGCSPSINIYGDNGIQGPPPRQQPMRTAGGHIHFGLPRQSKANLIHAAYALDGILGVAGVSLAEGLDRAERRMTYGRAGEVRFPKHGLEYRVLSNFHVLHPALTHLVYELGRVAVRLGIGGFYSVLFQGEQAEVRRIINENDVPAARKMIRKNEKLYMMLLEHCNFTESKLNARNVAMFALLHGIRSVIPTIENISKNWKLHFEEPPYISWSKYASARSVRATKGL